MLSRWSISSAVAVKLLNALPALIQDVRIAMTEAIPVSEEKNIEIVNSLYRNFLQGNMEALLDTFAEDIDWNGQVNWPGGPNPLPYTGKRVKREELAKVFAQFMSTVQYQKPLAENQYVTNGDRVLVVGQDMRRVLATGEEVESRWSMLWTIQNGKVVRARIYEDTVEALHDLEQEEE